MRSLALLLLLLLLPISAVKAQGDIHRCMGADGIPVFTDRVCTDVNAKPVMPAPVTSTSAPTQPSQAPAVTCAADMKQLKQAVTDAFAERNPNRLAGLTLWNGDGKDEVVADIRYFIRLMSRPLVEVKSIPNASSTSSDDDEADASSLSLSASPNQTPAHGEALIVQTESDDGSGATAQTRFDVVHRSGCVWLLPQGG
ncbi:DUF4124 domain-containing protein [Dyella nitratireducens]|uniref:DUF4124 domain-containing protein n=1 Tax=Dyella nitratireducens TaxID=1849580 RepID=A0ABQ1GVH6_9GAMM|nr:DUF4124 domain-containing protein [Dyella nitratireducens]GGA51197.1 hypothetical protein GCM10010981_45820 [Dyella nitratireducens]GLQ42696.1 hypothetical protein GCM10007902_25460 [Dyella nitratireducens]